MKAARCRRVWEVEAVRDGMLSLDAEMACALHVAHCEDCRAERRRLAAIAEQLARLPVEPDDISLRRLRERTLEGADGWLRRHRREDRKRVVFWATAGIALLSIFAVLGVRWSSKEGASHSRAVVIAVGNARWSRREESAVDSVELTDGELKLVVHHKPGDPRLSVRVPDGDVEDLGTTFDIVVRHGRTEKISVEEGRVVFHRRGRDAVFLNAGAEWVSEMAIAPEIAVPPQSDLRGPDPGADSGASPSAVRSHKTRPARPATSAGVAATPTRSEEDAAYLRVVALLKEGRSVEARAAARDYLDRFPNGFRRSEVRAVAEAP